MDAMLLLLLACQPSTDDSKATHDTSVTDTGVSDTDSGTTDSGDSDDSGATDSGDPDTGDSDSGATDSGDDSAGDSAGDTADTGEPIVLTATASVRENPDNPFSAFVTITVDHDADVAVTYGEGAIDHTTPATRATAGTPVDVLVLGLRAGRTFTLVPTAAEGEATWSGEALTFATTALSLGWPGSRATFYADESEWSADEAVCTNGTMANGSHMYYCMDRWGEPVFSMKTADDDSLLSVTPMPDGSWVSTSISSSKLAFFDAAGAETAEYNQRYFSGKTRFEHQYIDSHESYPILDGVWAGDVAIITDSYEYLADGSYKMGNGVILYNPTTREVDYDYSFMGPLDDGVAYDEMMSFDRDGYGDYAQDWNHTNAVLHGTDPDGREYLLLSLKAQDWIFKLYPDSDELAWRLGYDGEFTLVDDIDAADPTPVSTLGWAYHQHGMQMLSTDGARTHLLMLDNGYPRSDESGTRWDLYYSRVVEIAFDEDTRLAQVVYEAGSTDYSSPDWFFSSTCGNTEQLRDGAAVLTLDGENHQMREVGYPDGALRWTLDIESSEWCLYRAHWYPSLYETTWRYE